MRIERRNIDRSIAALAIPSLGALIAEPLFLAVDSALIGHLGATPLAGLAIASSVLTTAIGLMIFLAYSTTPLVARRRGAGDLPGAVQAGVNGLWLALALGIITGLIVWGLSSWFVGLYGADAAVTEQAVIFLEISALGIPAMLLVFAATGLLRGLQDTLTPLAIAGIGFTANALLNWWFIYGLDWGIAGSAWGTVAAQWGMVLVYLVVIMRKVRAHRARVTPQLSGMREAMQMSSWLFLRNLGLRIALLATVAAAASHGAAGTAGYQIIFIIVTLTAFGLDSLAIAAQALMGEALGARNPERARLILNRNIFWALVVGVGFGVVIAALSPVLGRVFTNDPEVLALLPPAIAIVGVTLPIAGVVYVLDGVLMGAGDMRYLAIASLASLAIYLPVLWVITLVVATDFAALLAITLAFTVLFMLLRLGTLWVRARGDRWMVLGVGS